MQRHKLSFSLLLLASFSSHVPVLEFNLVCKVTLCQIHGFNYHSWFLSRSSEYGLQDKVEE